MIRFLGYQVDSSLSFLDEYVSEALAAGAAPYKSPHQRQEELAQAKGSVKLEAIFDNVTCSEYRCSDSSVSCKHGALQPVVTYQHVLEQFRWQTVSHLALNELWSVR